MMTPRKGRYMSKKVWLHCEVSRGVFSDERAIGIATADGDVVSFFLPSDFVSNDEISVDIVARNGDYAVVALPRRTFEGSNVERVPMSALRFA
jgi:hypothetical protein